MTPSTTVRQSKQSLHKLAVDQVRQLILASPGQRLPSERDMSQQLSISRPRLRSIIASLQMEGLVETRKGSGTYALNPDQSQIRNIIVLIDSSLKIAEDPFVSHLVEEIFKASQASDLRCTIERINGDRITLDHEDGAIIFGKEGSKVLAQLKETDPPVISLFLEGTTHRRGRVSRILLDDYSAGISAVEILLSEGFRSIFFAGREDIPASKNRFEGAKTAAAERGVQVKFLETSLNYVSGIKLGSMIAIPSDKTAFIATNDWLALGIRSGLSGRVDRQDARIISFDGLAITKDPHHRITSLKVPIDEIAADVISELFRLSRKGISQGRTLIYSLNPDQSASLRTD